MGFCIKPASVRKKLKIPLKKKNGNTPRKFHSRVILEPKRKSQPLFGKASIGMG